MYFGDHRSNPSLPLTNILTYFIPFSRKRGNKKPPDHAGGKFTQNLLPTLVLTNRFKGSGFTFSTQLFAWVPLQTLFDFSQFFCFFIITLVSEIVKEKLCRYRKYYRANKIGLSRAPAPTFTFENLPIQLFDSLLCRKIALLGVSSTLCWCSARFDSAIPHSSLLT